MSKEGEQIRIDFSGLDLEMIKEYQQNIASLVSQAKQAEASMVALALRVAREKGHSKEIVWDINAEGGFMIQQAKPQSINELPAYKSKRPDPVIKKVVNRA